jgi:hypothetical protein
MLRIMPPMFDVRAAIDIDGPAAPVDAVATQYQPPQCPLQS